MLSFSALMFPAIDPVLVSLGPLAIRWYSLAYIAGILLGWWYINHLNARKGALEIYKPVLTKKALDDVVVWAVLGVVLGGRFGYVLFYKLDYYLANPSEAFALWHGGMSFHGGMLGVILAFFLFCRSRKLPFLRVMDLVACAAPIGLFFGRIANFINGELYGRVTDVSWGVKFPHGGDLPRHPSQIYEALLEGFLLFFLLWALVHYTRIQRYRGALAGVFLMGYGLSRFMVEFVREPDAYLGLLSLGMTMGQWLCVPMMLVGCGLIALAIRRA